MYTIGIRSSFTSRLPSPLHFISVCSPDGLCRNAQSCNMCTLTIPKAVLQWEEVAEIPAHLGTSSAQQIHWDNKTSCSEAFTDYLQRWSLSNPRKEFTFTWLTGLGGLMCRALFSQTSKFRPSHCQRQHTELNEAVGRTNMANLIALTTNMAHITLNYSTRRDWTHITKGEVDQGIVGIFSAT